MKLCTIQGCKRKKRFNTPQPLCRLHYRRWKNHGDFNRRKPEPYLDPKTGYMKIVTIDGVRMQYHRYLMEKYLGRKLDPHREQIHHKNQIKTDNRIENLEIVSLAEHIKKYHPKKRIVDWSSYVNPPKAHQSYPSNYTQCWVKNCENKPRTKNLCAKHYKSFRSYYRSIS